LDCARHRAIPKHNRKKRVHIKNTETISALLAGYLRLINDNGRAHIGINFVHSRINLFDTPIPVLRNECRAHYIKMVKKNCMSLESLFMVCVRLRLFVCAAVDFAARNGRCANSAAPC
jgi:hypothetical protein